MVNRELATFFIFLPRSSDRKEDVQGRCLSTFLRRPVAAILVEDEARYRSTRIANKGDLCVHVLGPRATTTSSPRTWTHKSPLSAPLASRTKVTCASTSLAKKSLLLSGQSCTGAPPMLDLIWSAPFCSVTSSSRPGASS